MNQSLFSDARARAESCPANRGVIRHLINRPSEGVHIACDTLELDSVLGIKGDRWLTTAWLRQADNSPDPRVQVSITNYTVMECFANQAIRPVFDCGDNLYTDLNLTEAELPIGSHLKIGPVTLKVSDVVNDACGKFAERFGAEAFQYIRDPENRAHRLRGIFCQIITGGIIRVGDTICKA